VHGGSGRRPAVGTTEGKKLAGQKVRPLAFLLAPRRFGNPRPRIGRDDTIAGAAENIVASVASVAGGPGDPPETPAAPLVPSGGVSAPPAFGAAASSAAIAAPQRIPGIVAGNPTRPDTVGVVVLPPRVFFRLLASFPFTESEPLNFKKLMVVVAVVVVLITAYKLMTRVDHTDPVKVATAFTKAMKGKDSSSASKYWVPAEAQAWRESTDSTWDSMKANQTEMYFDRIPSDPAFGPPVTTPAGTTVTSSDKQWTLHMTQIDGKWYVAKVM
jgi:hypothetical protein